MNWKRLFDVCMVVAFVGVLFDGLLTFYNLGVGKSVEMNPLFNSFNINHYLVLLAMLVPLSLVCLLVKLVPVIENKMNQKNWFYKGVIIAFVPVIWFRIVCVLQGVFLLFV